ncbi:unnamed protein product, partial [Prorocentrum cordatum]
EGPQATGAAAEDLKAAFEQAKLEVSAEVFMALDERKTGILGASEMLRFAELSGFEGGPREWREEFRLLCEEHGTDAGKGLDFEAFLQMVNDPREGGSYCTFDELEEIAETLSPTSPKNRLQLNGNWVNTQGEELRIQDEEIMWKGTGEKWQLEYVPGVHDKLRLSFEDGDTYQGKVVNSGRIKWSDGDQWRRKHHEERQKMNKQWLEQKASERQGAHSFDS